MTKSKLECTSCLHTIATIEPEPHARVTALSAICPVCNITVTYKEPTAKAKSLKTIDPAQKTLTEGTHLDRMKRKTRVRNEREME